MKFFSYLVFILASLAMGTAYSEEAAPAPEISKSTETKTETQKAEPVDPKFYTVIDGKRIDNTDTRIEVVELFWYTCPHCDGFDPYVKKWLKTKADDVAFYPMPAVFPNDSRLPLAKAFYVAQALNVLDKVHVPLFDTIHREHKNLSTADAIAKIFEKHADVSKKDFMNSYNSFSVDSAVRKAMTLTKSYGIQSVPSLVVNAKYRLNGKHINGNKNMLKIVDGLIAKEREAKK